MKNIVIIGNGVAGITAARHIRKNSKHSITVISGESDYFFSRTALMYVYMGQLRMEDTQPYENWFWEKNKIQLLKGWVNKIKPASKNIFLENGSEISYDKLIIASGSSPNKFGWPGQKLEGVQGLYSQQDLELLEKNSKDAKKAVIVGGGLIGVELAEMLRSRNMEVTYLIREDRFWGNVLLKEEAKLVQKEMESYGVNLKFQTELSEINGDENEKVKGVTTNKGEFIPCDIVGLTVGVSPNISFLKDSGIETDKGILVNDYLQTSVEDVYAIGDCTQVKNPRKGRKSIEAVWYTGRMMGETLAQTICGNPVKYEPGNWFNSAKFFELEYQIYGEVPVVLPDNLKSFYWQDITRKHCIRLVFEKESRKFIGVNTLGVRLRHEIMDKHLSFGSKVDKVLEELSDANFDPEFYKKYEKEIIEQFNKENQAQIKLKKKSWKRILERLK